MPSLCVIPLVSILIISLISNVSPLCSCKYDAYACTNLDFDVSYCSAYNNTAADVYTYLDFDVSYCSTTATLSFSGCRGSISSSEFISLQDFYDSTNGNFWNITEERRDSEWNFSDTTPCRLIPWYGITCGVAPQNSSADCTIVSLSFDSDVITGGTIPTSIGNLSNLEELNLKSNNLYSSIPSSLSNLTQLKVIDLGHNCLNGSIPSFDSRNLEEVSLEFNCLTGPVGEVNEELWNTSHSLQCISLSFNDISGAIPLLNNTNSNIQGLHLSRNSFAGSIPAFKLPRLQYLDISNNDISGVIDSSMYLPSLNVLNAGFNHISGMITQEMFQSFQNNITVINLIDNDLNGTIPELVSNSLKVLSLAFNLLSGPFPNNLELPNLEELSLGYNYLDGRLDILNITFQKLRLLELSSNLFEGGYYDFNSTNITIVAIGNNRFNGSLPDKIPSEIIFLDVGVNFFDGPVPCYNSTSLVYLNISNNNLHDTFPVMVTPSLSYLDIHNNNIEGKLNLRGYENLRYVDAGYNMLTGVSAPYSTDRNNLTLLILNQNFIHESGYALTALLNITNLKYLDISYNSYYGPLPDLYHNNLKSLYINYNQFTGRMHQI